MSSAVLEILDIKDLSVLGYGEYHGTSDTVPSSFVIDYEKEMEGQKRGFLGWNECKDHNYHHIDVYLLSHYGGPIYWPSTVCIKCKAIVGILSPVEPDWGYSFPSEIDRKLYTELYKKGYPKDGDPRESDDISV